MVELAEILRRFKARFLERFGKGLPFAQRRAMGAIEACRTPRLGGQVYQCPDCQKERYSYHSCKNRHCPKCQGDNARQWLEQLRALLLPVPYFLLTATLPAQLRPLARKLPKTIYNLLFQSATAALLKLTRDRKYLGGALPGLIAILHTWKRDLLFHPHIHCLVTGGGLSKDGKKWRATNNTYLVNVKACSKIYRAKFRDAINKAGLADQIDPKVWRKKWVVHVIPVGNGVPALKYLAPYVFRIAITNSSIEKLEGAEVTFRFRDGKTKIWRRCTLKAEELFAGSSSMCCPSASSRCVTTDCSARATVSCWRRPAHFSVPKRRPGTVHHRVRSQLHSSKRKCAPAGVFSAAPS